MAEKISPFTKLRRETAVEMLLDNKFVAEEFVNVFLGDYIGGGISRMVFAYNIDPKYVVKIEYSDYNANAAEHLIWQHVAYVNKLSRWFAPVKMISKCGRIMLQRRAKHDIDAIYSFKQVPAFLTDLKIENFGMIGNQLVSVDYAGCLLLDLKTDYKLRKSNWNG